MFTQVYFHKTRVAFDHHLLRAMAEMLPSGLFPAPTADQLPEFQRWDDWKVLGVLAAGGGGEHGNRLANRGHYREVSRHTPEAPKASDLRTLNKIRDRLGSLVAAEERADKSWYKRWGKPDIRVVSDNPLGAKVAPLSTFSSIVQRLRPIDAK